MNYLYYNENNNIKLSRSEEKFNKYLQNRNIRFINKKYIEIKKFSNNIPPLIYNFLSINLSFSEHFDNLMYLLTEKEKEFSNIEIKYLNSYLEYMNIDNTNQNLLNEYFNSIGFQKYRNPININGNDGVKNMQYKHSIFSHKPNKEIIKIFMKYDFFEDIFKQKLTEFNITNIYYITDIYFVMDLINKYRRQNIPVLIDVENNKEYQLHTFQNTTTSNQELKGTFFIPKDFDCYPKSFNIGNKYFTDKDFKIQKKNNGINIIFHKNPNE